jgi:hypothetical protein
MLEMRDGPGAGAADRARARSGGVREGGAVVLTADVSQHCRLVQKMLDASNMTVVSVAEQLGVKPQSVRQYLRGRRRGSLAWFIRLSMLTRCSIVVHLADGHARDDGATRASGPPLK